MLLADKIVTLRKRAGWSQEELAAQLGVSRQSVSKWEGAQSVPDMQKVVQMSRLFGVTTDYLLKEELGEPEPAPAESAAPLRCCRLPREESACCRNGCCWRREVTEKRIIKREKRRTSCSK